jgi:endonuclease/exonuclease/phosphatase family metal-dependent hydrolase
MKRAVLAFLALLLVLTACNGSTPRERPAPTSSTAQAETPAPPPSAAATEAGESRAPLRDDRLTLLTYNVLASPVFVELRTRAVLDILERSKADVIALQEVADWFLTELLAEPWARGYHMPTRNGQPFAPGGQVILSRRPIVRVNAAVLMGRQRREVLVAEIKVGERTVAIATSHMESFLEDGPTRARQLEAIFGMLARAQDAVFMGDMNFGDGEEPETSKLDPRYVDLWTALRPSDAGFTWNMDNNPFARIGAFVGEPNRRLDRILVRSDTWRPSAIAIIGDRSAGRRTLRLSDRARIEMPERPPTTEEPEIEVFPSDHYGLTATLTMP